MAHFDVYAPGGEQTEEQMRIETVKMHSTGKRWYVSYYQINQQGIRERKREYGHINSEKDSQKRMELLIQLQQRVFQTISTDNAQLPPIQQSVTIYKCCTAMAAEKKLYLKYTSFLAVQKNMRKFKAWLISENLQSKHPAYITKTDVLNYRNYLLKSGLSNRSVNNAFEEVNCFFNYLIGKEILFKNPCKNIKDIPSRSETHVAFTDDEAIQIAAHLRETNSWLLFYIKFIAYAFFRNNEARFIRLQDIDLTNRRILLTAGNNKVSKRMSKIIPDIFIDEFMNRDFSEYPKDYYLFGLKDKPGPKPVNKQYFTLRFAHVKKKFGYSSLHTLYGFRHTFVSQLLRSGKPWHEIMALTGHTTMASFQKYARSIMALPAKDLSDGFTVKM